jgi:hypothetical protein
MVCPDPSRTAAERRDSEVAGAIVRCGSLQAFLETRKAVVVIPLTAFLLIVLIEFSAIIGLNDGKLIFTLDDPYIHLALAENIRHGHYGVNCEEPSSPSSSIVWPFILAPFAHLSCSAYVIFTISLLASVGTLLVCGKIVTDATESFEHPKKYLFAAIVTALLIFATNLVGLIFNGMEHSLQLFWTVLVVYGLIREKRDKPLPWLLFAGIVLGPLVRYENLAISVPALIYLFIRGHRKEAVMCALPLVAGIAAFSLFLHKIGLPPFPASVLVKSRVVSSSGSLVILLKNLRVSLLKTKGPLLALATLPLIYVVWSPQRAAKHRLLALAAVSSVALHLIVGRSGWYSRYEIYVWTSAILAIIYLHSGWLRSLLCSQGMIRSSVLLGLLAASTSVPYLDALISTPLASNNIYEQQYQMNRFVTEYYQAPVAVNDLGWVSYRNDEYVLDLWGMGSAEALRAKQHSDCPDWMNDLMQKHDVRLAMVYDTWFPETPDNWILVGKLHLGRTRITPSHTVVTFYATDHATHSRTVGLLRQFKTSLPRGVKLTLQQ